jgi:hypothetical protein
MTTKSSAPPEAARARPLAEHADDGELLRADADLLADGIDVREERRVGGLAEHDERPAVLDFLP